MIDTKFIDELASKSPTPGGGGASAYVGALASALGLMVGNLTVGKEKYAEVEAEVYMTMERLESLRIRLIELIDEDAQAFAPLAAAYGLPHTTDEEKTHKQAIMQKALIGACEVPLEIMSRCELVLRENEFLAYNGSRLVLSDVGVAVVFAKAALQGASFNVFINTASMADKQQAAAYNEQAEKMIEGATAMADRLYEYIVGEIN